MANIKKYNLSGKEIGVVEIEDDFLADLNHSQMVKDYVVALRANARQWSASTKGRSEVAHTTKKPHRQKGTGAARQGSLVSPQYRGGGIVFGPKPKFDQHVRINRKERRLAIRQLLGEKVKLDQLCVVEDKALSGSIVKPKTKTVADFLKSKGFLGRRVLFIGEGVYQEDGSARLATDSSKYDSFRLSIRNLPRVSYALAPNVNGYDLLAARHIIISESALIELKQLLMAGM